MRALHLLAASAVLAFVHFISIPGASAQQPRGLPAASAASAEQQVREVEALRLKAFLDHDVKTMAGVLADEMIHTTTTGKTRDKAQFMDDFVNRPTAFAQFVTDAMDVMVLGDVAVTRGRYHNLVAQRSYGTPMKYARFLRVWVKRDGSWRLVSHQATEIEQAKK